MDLGEEAGLLFVFINGTRCRVQNEVGDATLERLSKDRKGIPNLRIERKW